MSPRQKQTHELFGRLLESPAETYDEHTSVMAEIAVAAETAETDDLT